MARTGLYQPPGTCQPFSASANDLYCNLTKLAAALLGPNSLSTSLGALLVLRHRGAYTLGGWENFPRLSLFASNISNFSCLLQRHGCRTP